MISAPHSSIWLKPDTGITVNTVFVPLYGVRAADDPGGGDT